MEEDSSELDEDDMAMMTHKFKNFFKKTKESARKKYPSKFKKTDREQFTGCFKCAKLDHIVKNYPQLKQEQEAKSFKKQAGNSSGRRFTRAMLAARGDSTEEEEGSKEEEAAVALMARSESDLDDESLEDLD